MRHYHCWLTLVLSLSACAPDVGSLVGGPLDVPACSELHTFGNGATCDDGAGGTELSACGDLSIAACSPGRLCFTDALTLACTCSSDGDCAARASYVNIARKAAGQPSIQARCAQGLCAGDLELPPVTAPAEQ